MTAAPDPPPPEDRPLTPGEAFAVEFAAVHGWCPVDANTRRPIVDEAALCLSGGGIRSASFCLGVVQALARRNLLSKFHYLSTVSGGGYLGGMLAAWSYRAPLGYADVERGLREGGRGEGEPLDWLRRQARYLAPKQGALSLDGWTLAATYVRNLILNALIWLPALGAVLAVPVLLATVFDGLATFLQARDRVRDASSVALTLGIVAVVFGSLELRRAVARDRRLRDAGGQPLQQPTMLFAPPTHVGVQRWLFAGVAALALGGFLLAFSPDPGHFWRSLTQEAGTAWAPRLPLPADTPGPVLFGTLLALLFAAMSFGYKPAESVDNEYRLLAALAGAVGGLCTGVAAGVVLDSAASIVRAAPDSALGHVVCAYVTVVPPLLVACIGLGEIVFVGGISRFSTDFDREWWSRAGASTAIVAVLWLALFGTALFGPLLIRALREAGVGLPAYWVSIALAGIVARLTLGREVPGGQDARPTLRTLVAERALDIASAIALLAILIGIAWLVLHALPLVAPLSTRLGLRLPARAFPYTALDVVALTAALGVVVGLAGLCVNVNRFSLHAMYRDRLIRTFLGATRRDYPPPPYAPDDADDWRESRQFAARNADSFIMFDRDDNPILRWLSPLRHDASRARGPLLVVNAALNLVAGRNLAWQERKSASFTLTPLTVGSPVLGYRPSGDYAGQAGGVTLGTAMAISGAAVSPNAGAQSSPVRTFLLTLFNARLGWWLGHPRDRAAVRSAGPRFAVGALVDELLGRTHDRKRWLFVSDGGHFENLGVYEMIRRGCCDIVVVDASCDRERKFDDLGNAIRKVRIDLGVRIERATPWSIGGRELQADGRYAALFRIVYPGGATGNLLYLKSAFYMKAEGLPIDVLQYAQRSPDFPHESTARQFYGESQFESYRALGEFEIDATIEGVKTPHRAAPRPIDSVQEFIEVAAVQLA